MRLETLLNIQRHFHAIDNDVRQQEKFPNVELLQSVHRHFVGIARSLEKELLLLEVKFEENIKSKPPTKQEEEIYRKVRRDYLTTSYQTNLAAELEKLKAMTVRSD